MYKNHTKISKNCNNIAKLVRELYTNMHVNPRIPNLWLQNQRNPVGSTSKYPITSEGGALEAYVSGSTYFHSGDFILHELLACNTAMAYETHGNPSKIT